MKRAFLLALSLPILSSLVTACGPSSSAIVPVVDVPGASPPPSSIHTPAAPATEPAPTKETGAIAWETSEVQARKRAKARGLPILVFLCAEWATPSVRMDRTTWSDPRVVARARSFVMLRLDVTGADANAQADADRFDLQRMPSTVILDENGREAVRFEGLAGPDEVLAAMNGIGASGN